MKVHVGTSGYAYREWKPSFYAADLPAKKLLGFYASQLGTVEINASFYKLPAPETVAKWASEVPAGFTFAMKAPQAITHRLRLVNAAAETRAFLSVAGALGKKLGPLLFQLPPFQKKDVARLEGFLEKTTRDAQGQARLAFEFRHASWFDDEVYRVLQRYETALCIAESSDLATPRIATTDWGYVRLRRDDYAARTINAWAPRVLAQPWKKAWVFVKHDDGAAPKFAASLVKALAKKRVSP
jgi:uncharacterized protein YecE (DUF72 family)